MEGKSVERNRSVEIGILICGALASFSCFAFSLALFDTGEPLVGTFRSDSFWSFYYVLARETICLVPLAAVILGMIDVVTGWEALRSRKGRISRREAIAAIVLGATGVIAQLLVILPQ